MSDDPSLSREERIRRHQLRLQIMLEEQDKARAATLRAVAAETSPAAKVLDKAETTSFTRKLVRILSERIDSVKDFDTYYEPFGLTEQELGAPQETIAPPFVTSSVIEDPPASFMLEYWHRSRSLPKAAARAASIREMYLTNNNMAELLSKISDRIRIPIVTTQVDGHACVMMDVPGGLLRFDRESLVLRHALLGPDGDTHYSDDRPLEGSRLSIPWRIEIRRGVTYRDCLVMKRALANEAVSDSLFTEPFHPDAKRIPPPSRPVPGIGVPSVKETKK